MDYLEDELKRLEKQNPQDEDSLIEFLGISALSPEGYYAILVYRWLKQNQE